MWTENPLTQKSSVGTHPASCVCGLGLSLPCHPQVSVNLLPGSVRVCVRDGVEEQVLMEGELPHKINTENSLWSLEPGRCVVVRAAHVQHNHTHTDTPTH